MNDIQNIVQASTITSMEVAEMVSVIDDMWILQEMKRFITGMTKDTKYEALVLEKSVCECSKVDENLDASHTSSTQIAYKTPKNQG